MHTFLEVTNRFNRFLEDTQLFPKEPAALYDPCRYLLEAGGKRIRPALCLMGQELFSELTEEGFRAALALELFHNFTLMHDDIMDNAPLRRGRPTVHIKYGQTTAILSGDIMSIYAYQQLIQLRPEMLVTILPLFNKMAVEVCEGQQWDAEFEEIRQVSVSKYLEMITLKTAVLIATSLQIGALIGGATKEQAQALYDFGKYMGIAFQLQDDYLDTFGSLEQTGKQLGGDILSKKKTILFTYYQSIAAADERKLMNRLYHSDDRDKVVHITEIWREAGVDKAVSEMVSNYTTQAIAQLKSSDIPTEKSQELVLLFQQLMSRKS